MAKINQFVDGEIGSSILSKINEAMKTVEISGDVLSGDGTSGNTLTADSYTKSYIDNVLTVSGGTTYTSGNGITVTGTTINLGGTLDEGSTYILGQSFNSSLIIGDEINASQRLSYFNVITDQNDISYQKLTLDESGVKLTDIDLSSDEYSRLTVKDHGIYANTSKIIGIKPNFQIGESSSSTRFRNFNFYGTLVGGDLYVDFGTDENAESFYVKSGNNINFNDKKSSLEMLIDELTLSVSNLTSENRVTLAFHETSLDIYTNSGTTFGGIKYLYDYSDNYTNRSLVDKSYVDTAIFNSGGTSYTSGNGITVTGTTINLGGDLTANTIIELTGNEYTLIIHTIVDQYYTKFRAGEIDVSSDDESLKAVHNILGFYVQSNNYNIQINNNQIQFGNNYTSYLTTNINSSSIIVNSGNPTFSGLTYSSDYSANYTNRSLVDKSYVDSYYISGFTDDIPTNAEIVAVLGTASSKGAGFKATLKDNTGTSLTYFVVSDGTDWYYYTGTKAV